MAKFIHFFLAWSVFSASVMAADDESITISVSEGGYVTGERNTFMFEWIDRNDLHIIENLVEQCEFKEGFPSLSEWEEHLEYLEETESPYYNILSINERAHGQETPVAVLGLNRADPSKWEDSFQAIVDKYVKQAGDGLGYAGKPGLGLLTPVIPPSLEAQKIRQILKIGIEVFQYFRGCGYRLPEDQKLPTYVLGFFHPQDPLIPHLEAVGFEILRGRVDPSYSGSPYTIAALNLSSAIKISGLGADISGVSPHFVFRHIQNDDISKVKQLVNQCKFKKSLPCNIETYFNTWIKLQRQGNPYCAYIIEEQHPVAVLGMSWLNVGALEPHCKDIIDTYMGWNIVRFKKSEAKRRYTRDNIESVDSQGVGALIPIVPMFLESENVQEILRIGIAIFRHLKKSGERLPVSNALLPTYIVDLLDPADPLIPHLQEVGFTVLSKKGFRGAATEPCVMAYCEL